jgi:hypothetical protein
VTTLACTLLADGVSDRVLQPVLRWLLDTHCPDATDLQFAEYLPGNPKGLAARMATALDQYPCKLLFVHRDAEAIRPEVRQREIDQAWAIQAAGQHLVAIIPVRMTEAWLLLDETAIRSASGNPNGTMPLKLPGAARLESLKDPKELLFEALRTASGRSPGRLNSFSPEARRHRVAELMVSYEPLRALPSFLRLEAQLQQIFLKT